MRFEDGVCDGLSMRGPKLHEGRCSVILSSCVSGQFLANVCFAHRDTVALENTLIKA